jgi:hypothetical protein
MFMRAALCTADRMSARERQWRALPLISLSFARYRLEKDAK